MEETRCREYSGNKVGIFPIWCGNLEGDTNRGIGEETANRDVAERNLHNTEKWRKKTKARN